jgi:pyruvate/2-oxoglutarate dehydrogenase complex dihydrolipoamide acyltransferase (E2) component
MTARQGAVARERRHTLHFLQEIRQSAPVFLDTVVDMTRVLAHRAAARAQDRKYSVVSYYLYAAARVLSRHPEANAAIRGRWRPRVMKYLAVDGKLTLDKTLGGQRVVLSAILPDLGHASLDDIQRQVDRFRDCDPAGLPEFAGARLMHRLPVPVGSVLYRLAVRPLRRRAEIMGTVAITSLGHAAVDGFYSVGGTTITLGIGRTIDRPAARDGQLVIAPTARLSLTFDHRVIDGAEAAAVLTEINDLLESFPAGSGSAEPAAESARPRVLSR